MSDQSEYTPVCIQATPGDSSSYVPFVIETPEDRSYAEARDLQPFPDSTVGCAAYNVPNPDHPSGARGGVGPNLVI